LLRLLEAVGSKVEEQRQRSKGARDGILAAARYLDCRAERNQANAGSAAEDLEPRGQSAVAAVAIYGTLYGVLTKTTVYLDSDTVLALRRMSESQGRSQAELIRDALVAYTNSSKRPLPRGLGKYDGETHGAEKAKGFLRSSAKKGRWRQ
jgi:hypothetical protein